ncbi:hypothetical protein [Streptomyces botrytidirepellens]|uniref:Uncharacterized protein n=1 Tax=Streptomyces botrytidirepellens TaxID=2486417 RepID=A0A3M8X6M4_9ACTN|nr:hypothetical protein [Streptomyces botrytidirepellens]RNG38042.1 hypothetical protein EEJ42_02020 [Streptomyces botrytidirepellens]
MPTVNPLGHLMGQAAVLLEHAGDLPRLCVGLRAGDNAVQLKSLGHEPLSVHRGAIDRIAELLGAQASMHQVVEQTYAYSVQGEWESITVQAMALTPNGRHPAVPRARSTTTADTVALLRDLRSWASALDLTQARKLDILDSGAALEVMLHIDSPGNREGAAQELAGSLPNQLDRWQHGSGGQALLPTGHTLIIHTL